MTDLETIMTSAAPVDMAALTEAVRALMLEDPARLFLLLYRVDVSEKKLKQKLAESPDADAADVVAEMILQRLEEKQRSRAAFPPRQDIPEEERW